MALHPGPGSRRRQEVAAAARVWRLRSLPCRGPAAVICFVKVFSTSFSSHFVKINVPTKSSLFHSFSTQSALNLSVRWEQTRANIPYSELA